MNLSMRWLKDYVDYTGTPKEFSDAMTMSGSKVEGYTTVAGEIKNVVTGYIKEIVKHPDADKLVICTIDAGQGRDLTIVTGAPNVRVGDYVPVALNHSVIAGGTQASCVGLFPKGCSALWRNWAATDTISPKHPNTAFISSPNP